MTDPIDCEELFSEMTIACELNPQSQTCLDLTALYNLFCRAGAAAATSQILDEAQTANDRLFEAKEIDDTKHKEISLRISFIRERMK